MGAIRDAYDLKNKKTNEAVSSTASSAFSSTGESPMRAYIAERMARRAQEEYERAREEEQRKALERSELFAKKQERARAAAQKEILSGLWTDKSKRFVPGQGFVTGEQAMTYPALKAQAEREALAERLGSGRYNGRDVTNTLKYLAGQDGETKRYAPDLSEPEPNGGAKYWIDATGDKKIEQDDVELMMKGAVGRDIEKERQEEYLNSLETEDERKAARLYYLYYKDYGKMTPEQQAAEARRLRAENGGTQEWEEASWAANQGNYNASDAYSRYWWLINYGDKDAMKRERDLYNTGVQNKIAKRQYEENKKTREKLAADENAYYETILRGLENMGYDINPRMSGIVPGVNDNPKGYYNAFFDGRDEETVASIVDSILKNEGSAYTYRGNQKTLSDMAAMDEKINVYERLEAINATTYDYMSRPDFEEKSKPGEYRTPQEEYDARLKHRRETLGMPSSKADFDAEDALKVSTHAKTWEWMEDGEKQVWFYLMNTVGEEAAKEYLKGLDVVASIRELEKIESYANEGSAWDKIGYSIISVPESVFGAPEAFVRDIVSAGTGNYNPYYADALRKGQAARAGVSADWHPVGQFLYNAGMSAADSALGAVTMGSNYTFAMGMGAASQRAKELWEQGASTGQIVAGAGLAGVAEALFEKVSLDRLLSEKTLHGFWDRVKEVLIQGGVEASEEAATGLANVASDIMVRGDQSDTVKLYKKYLEENGGDETAALWKTIGKTAADVGLEALAGALSGGLLGAAFTAGSIDELAKEEAKVKSTADAVALVNKLALSRAYHEANGTLTDEYDAYLTEAENRVIEKWNLDPYLYYNRDVPGDLTRGGAHTDTDEGAKFDVIDEEAYRSALRRINEENRPFNGMNETAPGEGAAVDNQAAVENQAPEANVNVQTAEPVAQTPTSAEVPKANVSPETQAAGVQVGTQGETESAAKVQRNAAETVSGADVQTAEPGVRSQSERRVADQAERDRAGEEYVGPDTVETGVAERTGKLYGATPYQRGVAAEFAAITGRTVRFEDPKKFAEGESARYEESTGAIILNPESIQPVEGLLTHEFLHSIEGTEFYSAIKEWALSQVKSKFGKDLTTLRTEFRDRYQADIDEKSAKMRKEGKSEAEIAAAEAEYVDQEIVAMFGQKYMFSDMAEIRALAQQKPTLSRRVRRFLGEMLRKHNPNTKLGRIIYSDMKRAYDAYGDALRAAKSGQAPAKGEGVRNSIERTQSMSWREQVKRLFSKDGNNKLRRNDTLVLSPNTPEVTLKDIGEDLPLAIPISVITKATSGDDVSHSISRSNIKYLDRGLYNMVASIYEPDLNAFVIVTDLEQNGKPIVIAFDISTEFDGDRVHKASTIHSKQDFAYFIEGLENSIIRVTNKNKFDDLARKDDNLIRVHESTELVYEDDTTSPAESQGENRKSLDDVSERESPDQTKTENFRRWFGDSEAVNDDGTPLELYHQTEEDFTVFDVGRPGAGYYDNEMPSGIFMKPTPDTLKLGLNYDKSHQMALYASIQNPLRFNDRAEALAFWEENVPGYRELKASLDELNSEYRAREKQIDDELFLLEEKDEDGRDPWERATDELMDEWTAKENEISRQMKDALDRWIADSDYDGIILENDKGTGGTVKTYVAFENTQVKSATDNVGTFDRSDPDIRHSYDDVENDEGDAMIDRWRDQALEDLEGTKEQREQKARSEKAMSLEEYERSEDRRAERRKRRTEAERLNRESADAIAAGLRSEYHLKKSAAKISGLIAKLYDFMDDDPKLSSSWIRNAVSEIAETAEYKAPLLPEAEEVLSGLRGTKIYLDEKQVAEIKYQYGSLANFTRKFFGGKVTFTTDPSAASSLDSLWQELSGQYPWYFDSEVTSNDMPAELLDVYERARGSFDYSGDADYDALLGEIEQKIKDAYPSKERDDSLPFPDAEGTFVRPGDGERRADLMRTINGFEKQEASYETEQNWREDADREAEEIAERRKAVDEMNKIIARAEAQYFAEENGVPSEEIEEVKKIYGSDAAVLGALAADELHRVTHRNTADAMKRLAGEAKAIREGREARAKAWGELFGEAKRRVTFEGDEEVLAWNKRHLDDLISRVISDNNLSDSDVYLAGLIAAGERDASHIPNEAKKRAITLLADMYATRNAFDGKAAKTSPLVDLGVWIDSPLVSNYMDARAVIGLENARKDLDQQIAAMKRGIAAELGKERAAKIFSNAQSIADHINTMKSFADLTANEQNKLWHLARLMRMRAQLVGLGTGDVRVRVKEQFDGVLRKILSDPTKAKRLPMLVLNATTFVRNNRSTFGEKVGEAINEALFRPIVRNEAEKIRFENRELSEFDAACGSFDAESSALLQFMIERGIGADNVDRVDMRRELDMYLSGIDPTENADAKAKSAVQQMNILARKIRERFHISDEKLARKYAEQAVKTWGEESERMRSSLANISDEELNRIARAADFMRGKYAIYYEAINEFLVMHGYKPIPFRTSYAPHMQSEAVKKQFSKVAKALGIGEAVFELPTSIAGRTDAFRPGKKWDPHFEERVGKATLMDAVTGFERYISYMSEVLYHTDDVQKLRQFSEYLRTYFADDTIKAKIEKARTALAHGEIDAEEAEGRVTAALKDAASNTALSNYVSVLDDYANVIAGKQTKFDRAMESFFGRRALNAGRRLQNRFVTASIVGNQSSAINQTVQLPMVAAECGYANFNLAVADIASGRLNSTMGFDDMSDFITGKRGVTRISELTKYEKLIEEGQIPFELVDDLASRIVVRAKYFQLINEGATTEEALRKADEYADSVIGSRMKGAKPLLFHSKNLVATLFSTFQLEVANAWDHVARDMPREIRNLAAKEGKSAAAKKAAAMLLKYLLSAFLLNRLLDELYGQTPVMFDVIGYFYESVAEGFGVSSATFTKKILTGTLDTLDEFDSGRAGKGAKDALLDDVPYVSSALAMFGDSSSRLPLPNFRKLGNVPDDISAGIGQFGSAENFGDYMGAAGRMTDGLWYTAKGIVPFGNQFNKTMTGLTANVRGGGYDRNGNLMYPQSWGSFDGVTSLAFGSGANNRAGDYYASGYKGLNERGTDAYRELIDTGMDHGEAFDLVRTVSAFAPDEIEEEPAVANDLFEWLKQDYLKNEFMTDAEKAAENELQSRVEKQIAFLDSQDELTDEQRLIAFRTLCASKSMRDMLGWIENDKAGEVYDTVRDIVMSQYVPDSPSKGEIIENSALSDDSKGTLWSVLAASKKDAAAAVRMHDQGESWGDIYRAYSGVASARSAAKDAGEVQATAGRAAVASSSLSDEAKYDMYIASYGEDAKAPGVMEDWVSNGATKGDAVKWMSAFDGATWIGNDAYKATLKDGYNCEGSAGGETAARMETMLDQGMTARELETMYFNMMVTSSNEKKARENFDKIKDAGGSAVDYFEAYVAVSKATWKANTKNAASEAKKKAIDSTGASKRVREVLYDIFEVAKSVR